MSSLLRDTEGRTFPELRHGVYRHWRGHRYLPLGYASASDSIAAGDPVVVYVSLEADGRGLGPPMHVRSAQGFWQRVALDAGPVPRFAYEAQVWMP